MTASKGVILMHTLIIFDSEYGNTGEVADAIAEAFQAAGPVEVTAVHTSPAVNFPNDLDMLIVGGPTQMHGLSAPMRAFLQQLPAESLAGVSAAAFDTRAHGWQLVTGAASGGIATQLKKHGARLVVPPESFVVTAKEGPLMDGELARARTWAAQVLAACQTTSVAP
jgi:flavodoxin